MHLINQMPTDDSMNLINQMLTDEIIKISNGFFQIIFAGYE
jgi:hypothetical protein